MLDKLIQFDIYLFKILNSLNTEFFDKVMFYISAKYTWLPLYIVILVYLIWRFRWKFLIILMFVIILITLSDQISLRLFKNLFHRLRPCHNPQLENIVHIVNNKCGGQYGFVSSHAANSFAFATFISNIVKNRYFGYFIFIWASIVSYSRIYLGVHFPADILAGALLGILIGVALKYLYYKYCLKKSHD